MENGNKAPRTRVRVCDLNERAVRNFTTGVSLHCHTENSHEKLDFVPYYAGKIPLVSNFLDRELELHRIKNGEVIDFARAFWTPPIHPRAVLEAESNQIELALGLRPIVSITDHDDIRSSAHLRVLSPDSHIPISLEWTVPFGCGFFHVGVHNLPQEESSQVFDLLRDYSRDPQHSDLAELFEMLCDCPRTLVVLNHPLWDIERIGEAAHLTLLRDFLSLHGRRIHAIEVNGYRSWHENQRAIELAGSYGYPVISGGDRHGHEANSIVNLTNADTFSEFAAEIRNDRVSEVAILPAYKEPVAMRMLETVADVLKYYPGYPKGRRFWTDRIFWTLEDGSIRPMSFYWKNGGPVWVRASLNLMKVIGSRRARPAMRLVFARDEGAGL
jgi:hypothetical protein